MAREYLADTRWRRMDLTRRSSNIEGVIRVLAACRGTVGVTGGNGARELGGNVLRPMRVGRGVPAL